MRVPKIAYVAIAALMLFGAAMGAVRPNAAVAQDSGNTLIMARAVDATGLDPHTQTAFTSLALASLIYEPLVRTDAELNLVPALAESWEFSEDGLTLTFKLREGVTFHDGSDFTSADVIASFERILDEETGSATRTNLLSIESMDAVDDYTVALNLTIPDVPLLAALSSLNAMILSSDVIATGDPATDAIGTGPFMLDEWVPEERTTLTTNANWWGEVPTIDGIELRIIPDESTIMAALRAGEIDFGVLNDPLIATLPTDGSDVTINRAKDLAYHVLQLRSVEGPLSDPNIRQAMSCAIDRQEVLDAASLGEGTVTGPLTSDAWALPTDQFDCYTKDLDRAKELMAASEYPDGFDLTVMAATGEPPTAITEAESIQAQLAEIGINIEIEPLELSVYVDRWLAGDFDAAIALNGGRVDPYTTYSRYWMTDSQFQNVAGYTDDTLNDLMTRGQVETDPVARKAIFDEFQTHLTSVSPWIWLYTGFVYTGQTGVVSGFVPDPTGSLFNLSAVTLNR